MRTITTLDARAPRGRTLESVRSRVMVTVVLFVVAFAALSVRVIDLGLTAEARQWSGQIQGVKDKFPARADIIDRNGVLLATDLTTISLSADPRAVTEPELAARQIAGVLEGVNIAVLTKRLGSSASFVWLKRKITPTEQHAVNQLGIPGLEFREEIQRLYPQGNLLAHIVGFNNIDNEGLSGIERAFDEELQDRAETNEPLQLSVDTRVQHALHEELSAAMTQFNAEGGAGIVLDVRTGEVVAMVSLPDFNPNHPGKAATDAKYINRAAQGVYEMGSTFKTFTMAMALEHGIASMEDSYDATRPIHIARFTIRDDHPKARWLNLPEIYMYSSNIGSARIAVSAGEGIQKAFMQRLGLLNRPDFELLETGTPIVPEHWRDIQSMTVAYGHGIAVSGLQLANGVAALVNGGALHRPTLLLVDREELDDSKRVVTEDTSNKIRGLMRLVVERGTGRNADAPGYLIGGKTGTAEKSGYGGYRRDALITSFVAAFPITDPRYVVFVMLDEPHGNEATYGFASAGWTAAPIIRNLVPRIAPLLGVAPTTETSHPVTRELIKMISPEVRS
ncbi:MAG: penicillin-binding protein 2 [Alphaproteobacteria bacterium]|nr:MAG: penicillin-binding protein 2 [Alphaproteobacteria bacterium]